MNSIIYNNNKSNLRIAPNNNTSRYSSLSNFTLSQTLPNSTDNTITNNNNNNNTIVPQTPSPQTYPHPFEAYKKPTNNCSAIFHHTKLLV